MKQLLKVAALALCAVGLMSSCCKKTANEPTPTPTPTPVPVDPSKSLTLTLAPDATTFVLGGLTGQDVMLEGATAKAVAADGNVEEWSFYENEKQVQHTFTAKAGATIKIKGNVRSIAILEGKFEEINLSNAPKTFIGFYFFENAQEGSISLNKLNIGNLPDLQYFYLGANPSFSKGGPELRALKVDMSGLSNLKELALRTTQGEVTFPKNLSKLSRLFIDQVNLTTLPEVNTANFPAMQRFYLRGSHSFGERNINFANHQNIELINLQRSPVGHVDLSGSPKLKSVTFKEGWLASLSLLNCPNVNLQKTIETLPKATKDGGNFKSSATLTEAQQKTLTDKGWKVVAQ